MLVVWTGKEKGGCANQDLAVDDSIFGAWDVPKSVTGGDRHNFILLNPGESH